MPGGQVEPRGCHDVNGFRHFLWTHAPLEEIALRIDLSEALAQRLLLKPCPTAGRPRLNPHPQGQHVRWSGRAAGMP